jgi:methylated-DNA-[protein]-cysteine S-methyltransferase
VGQAAHDGVSAYGEVVGLNIQTWHQPSPLGELMLAVSPAGVCAVDWAVTPIARRRIEAIGVVTEAENTEVRRAFDQYFSGDIDALSELAVDLCLVSSRFVLDVLTVLHELSVGVSTSYGELARRVGRPGAAQAVGQAVGANPVPIIVPCHRVLSADGSLGGFSGGLANKRSLLALEGFADLPGGWQVAGEYREQPGQLTLEI